MTYSEAVDFLYDLQFFGIKLGLENTKRFLKTVNCDKPEAKIVHIAGTNGKGSTASMVASIAEASGLNVGLYTSPHILDFRERIRINNECIPEDYIIRFVETYHDDITSLKLTFFEVTTVLAIAYFNENNVDVIVLETGMGGRLDATNCFLPIVSVITNVSLDHQGYLGDTLSEITSEKAGIIKPNVLVITASQNAAVVEQLQSAANSLNSEMILVNNDDVYDNHFNYLNKEYKSPLIGKHQQLNAKLALTICDRSLNINEKFYSIGLEATKWKGRLEVWDKFPNIYLDVSHNVEGVKATVETLKIREKGNKLVIVFAFLDDKDTKANLSLLKEIATEIYSYPLKHYRAQDNKAVIHDIKQFEFTSFKHFLEQYPSSKILVIGSHYLLEDVIKKSELD